MRLRMRSPLPSFAGAAAWINAHDAPKDLQGKPVLVQFWSVGCFLCHEVSGRVNEWRDRYEKRGLRFIAVHQPRSEAELDSATVRADALDSMGLQYPCAIDNDHAIVDRFGNDVVPAYYLFDRNHEMRHFQAGDKGYDRIEAAVERVLAEPIPQAAASSF